MTASGAVTTRQCPACGTTVPAATFCGQCGADQGHPVTTLTLLLRPKTYAADPRETVWVPFVNSTFFTRFPARQRAPFRLGLILVVVAIITLAALRMTGPLMVTAIIGWPLLGLIYLWQSGGYRDIPVRVMVAVNVLGAASGIGLWLLTAKVLANDFGVSTGAAFRLTSVLEIGWLITAGGAILMVLPAVVARLIPMQPRESLEGFVIGTSGAVAYWVTAATTGFGPQFAEGLLDQPSAERLVQAAISNGIVNPIVTTAAGGLVGLRLWFTPDDRAGRDPRPARRVLTLLTSLAVPGYLTVWAVDTMDLPPPVRIAIELGLAALALLTLRCAVQIALLWEKPDPASGEPELCAHCERVVPDMPFCSSCGAAARASARGVRRRQRELPPVPV